MALGRGLGAILDEVSKAYENEVLAGQSNRVGHVREIALEDISPNPYQPRQHFDQEGLWGLSESIKQHGLLQPIVVVDKGESYLLIAGERRLRAHELAGLKKIRAIIADVDIDEIRLRELALMENIQRENLNAIELAHAYDELIKVYGITHDGLSSIVNKSRSQITNTLRLLSLSEYVQKKLIDGAISQGHAKVLVGLGEKEQQLLVETIIEQTLSVREAELLAKNTKLTEVMVRKNAQKEEGFMVCHQEDLSRKLPFSFKLKKDTLEIKFKKEEELQKFLAMLG